MTTTSGILPTYQRLVNGVPATLFSRRSFRPRERYLIFLVFLTFGAICFGTFFFLPDFRSGGVAVNSVYRVYQHIQKAGPELLIPAPPYSRDYFRDNSASHAEVPDMHANGLGEDVHLVNDKLKLQVCSFNNQLYH